MAYRSLREFITKLEAAGELVRVSEPVSTVLEMTEIHRRLLKQGGPAVLFENVIRADGERSPMPCLVNLFGTVKRVAMGVTLEGRERTTAADLREVGELLAFLRRQGFARIQMPFGDTHLAELPEGPLVLIAAGTGMAQMHSLIEYCRAAGFPHPVHLYWGVRRPEDFYRLPHWEEWQGMSNLHLHRVVSDVCGWEGRCGMLHANYAPPPNFGHAAVELRGDGAECRRWLTGELSLFVE